MLKKAIYYVFGLVILFFYVFDFTLPVIQRSSILALFLLLFLISTNKYYRQRTTFLFRKKFVRRLILGYLGILIFSAFIPVLHQTYDFTFIKTLIANLIALFTAVLLVAYLLPEDQEEQYLLGLIVSIFVLQSLIELAAFASPQIQSLVSSFNSGSELQQERGIGFRSLALSNATVATLGGVFGVLYILFFYRLILKRSVSYSDLILLGVLIIGNFFGGRIGYVGLVIGVIGFVFYLRSFKTVVKLVLYGISVSILLTLFYNSPLIPRNVKGILDNRILPWVFEGYYKYQLTGSLETGSTNDLFRDHYFPIPADTFILGDGRFYVRSDSNETYMHTDAGVMRIILYGGIVLQALMIAWTIYLLSPLRKFGYRGGSFLFYMLFAYILLFHVKTVSFGYATFNNRLIFLAVFQVIYLVAVRKRGLAEIKPA